MDLKSYLQTMTIPARKDFARKAGTSLGHLTNISYGHSTMRPQLCVAVERLSDSKVKREDLRSDYADIWPDLAPPAAKPKRKAR
jgi:DNA-binding transcriptional regulator YdaS (Cro superfamily)